jgi:hypothetical protein
MRNLLLVAAALLSLVSPAWADTSREVTAAFKGQLVVSKGELPQGKNDKETIAKIKKERLPELTGAAGSDVTRRSFH